MAKNAEYAWDFTLSDEPRMLLFKTVLGYEAGVRGLTLGQALLQLVEESANVKGYPQEVRDLLQSIDEASRSRAAERAIEAIRLPKSA